MKKKLVKWILHNLFERKKLVYPKKQLKKDIILIVYYQNIQLILSKYKDHNYIDIDDDINPTSLDGDPYFQGAYFGESIDPYEVIFYKNNR